VRRYRIVLQARTTSQRLPAKVLLPIGGLPLAVLCARRLQNSGRELVLATSDDASDDQLARLCEGAGIRVFRGSLDDVLHRYAECTQDLRDDDVVVRATADNPLPDGAFADLLIERFERGSAAYLGTDAAADGLPYGLSAEVFTAGALREADRLADSRGEREHVTPGMRRRSARTGAFGVRSILDGDISHLRCTVDTLQDYLNMAAVFARCPDPVQAPWRSLLDKLPRAAHDAGASRGLHDGTPAPIVLGTAQLGMPYGIANRAGCPSEEEAQSMLGFALANGIDQFDTARAYGIAERRIGVALAQCTRPARIYTKLAPLTDVADDATDREVVHAVEASVMRSCHALRRSRLDVLLFHRAADLTRWRGAALAHAAALQEEGVVGELGASVYDPEEAIRCAADPRLKHVQIPFNLLDRRWAGAAFRQAIDRRPDLRVHARSVFLQGLLISDANIWPKWSASSACFVDRIGELCRTLGRRNPIDLCIAYVRAFPWVSTLVLGADSRDQLAALLEMARERPLSSGEAELVQDAFPDVPARLLNPAEWHS